MSGTKNRPHKRRNIILLVLLALLCIGGVECFCFFAGGVRSRGLPGRLMLVSGCFGGGVHSNLQELLSRPGKMKW